MQINIFYKQNYNHMSFFGYEDRKITNNKTKSDCNVGPASYTPTNHKQQPSSQSYAPFGSLIRKHNSLKKQSKVGPGRYDISGNMASQKLKKYENKNIIVVKINNQGSYPFQSRNNRFDDKKVVTQLGPGSYDVESPKKYRSEKKKVAIENIRKINKSYFEERRVPTLKTEDNVGYQIDHQNHEKKKGVIDWGLNKKQRFQPLVKEQMTESQKSKILQSFSRNNSKNHRKAHSSAVFISKSLRTHFQAQTYNTNNSFKAELRKMIDYKDETPGPCSYQKVPLNKKSTNHHKYQFFGSTVDRFQSQQKCKIGPGHYNIDKNHIKRVKTQHQDHSSGLNRHSYISASDNPGPGAYELKQAPEKMPPQFVSEHHFGSKQNRFDHTNKKSDQVVNTEGFDLNTHRKNIHQKRQQQIKIRNVLLNKHESSSFASNVNRFQRNINEVDQKVNYYDITKNDISTKLKKQIQAKKKLQQCQLYQPPFLSSIQRFKGQKLDQDNPHQGCWCQNKVVERQVFMKQTSSFANKQKKSVIFQVKNQSPPVGKYNTSNESFIKKTHNSKWKKQNQNKIKKQKIMNKKQQNKLNFN